jgi:hypothetical protein
MAGWFDRWLVSAVPDGFARSIFDSHEPGKAGADGRSPHDRTNDRQT